MNTNTNKFLLLCEENNYEKILNFYNNKDGINIRFNNDEAFRVMCVKGNLELIKWILKIDPNIDIFIDSGECFNILCRNGHYKSFIWLYLKYCDEKSLNNIYSLFIDACKGGNIKLIKYVFSIYEKNLTDRMGEILNFICRYGNIELLHYILTQLNSFEKYNWYSVLENCYMSENLEIIIYMTNLVEKINKFKEEYKIFLFDIVTFISNIKVIRWFINKYNITDLSFDNNSLFFSLLDNDNFEGISYILEIDPNIKNIIRNNLEQHNKLKNFILNSDYINIKTLKLILNNFENINIMDNDHLFFRNNCSSHNINIVLFIAERYSSDYHVEIKNSEIVDWYIKRKPVISKNKVKKNIEKCPICLDKNSEIISSCHHQFCLECIKQVYYKSRNLINCPICRCVITKFDSLINK